MAHRVINTVIGKTQLDPYVNNFRGKMSRIESEQLVADPHKSKFGKKSWANRVVIPNK